ncbi:MAG TPA: CbtA family protein [Thermoleophilaceae bacterium]|nr:CbtA family protein [Thermoleophilaceae bacterium]
MLRALLVCGLLAGACAGLVATGFAELVGEPPVEEAIAFEESQTPAGAPAEPELVARLVQRGVGLVTAASVYGLALGGLFSLAFAAVYGQVGRSSPARTALWLAAIAFVVVFLVPFVKYPANPPGVGETDTIAARTELYFAMLAISLLAAVAAARVHTVLAERRSQSSATGSALVSYVVVVVVAGLALPGADGLPTGFPAATLWEFREASVGTQLVLWTALGLVFAATAPRVMLGQPMRPWRSPARGEAVATTRD